MNAKIICKLLLYALIMRNVAEITAADKVCVPVPIDDPCVKNYTLAKDLRTCVRYTDSRLNWTEARTFCQQDNADLVVIYSLEKRRSLLNFLNKKIPYSFYWLSLNDRLKEGEWTWEIYTPFDDANNSSGKPASNKRRQAHVYTRWQDGQPYDDDLRNRDHDCSIVFMDDNKFYVTHCELKYKFICEVRFPRRAFSEVTCPPGWETNVQLIWECLKVFTEPLTWTEAVKVCKEHNSSILTIDSRSKLSAVKIIAESVWVGASKEAGGKFKWPQISKTMLPHSPSSSAMTLDKCKFIELSGPSHEVSCSKSHPFVCESEAFGGPSNVHLEIPNYRLENTFFFTEIVEIVCTALDTETGEIMWTAVNKLGQTIQLNASVTQEHERIQSESGLCRKRTVSRYRFKATRPIALLHISCFAYQVPDRKKCRVPVTSLQFCDAYRGELNVIDGPKKAPVLTMNYKGYPGAITPGGRVTAWCSAYTGETGMLMWVIFDKYTSHTVNTTNKSVPITYVNVTLDMEWGRHETSFLQFDMLPSMSGRSVACFAYNAVHYLSTLECRAGDIFCVQSHNITVGDYFTGTKFANLQYFVLPLLCLGMSVVMYPLVRHKQLHDEGDGWHG